MRSAFVIVVPSAWIVLAFLVLWFAVVWFFVARPVARAVDRRIKRHYEQRIAELKAKIASEGDEG